MQKLQAKYESDTAVCVTLQSMVQTEMDAGTTTASGSATDALLWLKRWVYALAYWDLLCVPWWVAMQRQQLDVFC